MGIIRGTHTAPGIYTSLNSVGRVVDTRNNRKGTVDKKPQPGGGVDKVGDFKFSSISGNTTIGLVRRSSNQSVFEYSTDGENWANFITGDTIQLRNAGDEVFVRGVLNDNNTEEDYTQFSVVGKTSISGDINALWGSSHLKNYCGYGLFSGCTGIVDVSELSLPSLSLSDNCYQGMFNGCSSLTTEPELPATTLSDYCYNRMFYGCSSLTTAPELPATTLAYCCYNRMFYGCSSLTTVPELPATTLSDYCYYAMFYNCSKLSTAPQNMLPATTLASYCYSYMFGGCSRLTTAPVLPATELASGCYRSMFSGCSSLTTAPEILPCVNLPYTKWTAAGYGNIASNCTNWTTDYAIDGCYTHMFADCTSLTTAPIFPAKRLTPGCYNGMFYRCTKLTRVIILAETLHVDIQDEWVDEVAAIVVPHGGTANKAWMEKSSAICWIDHSGVVATRKWAIPQSAYNDWIAASNTFTHVTASELEIMSQEEIDEIIERYHIHYDD